MVNALLSNESVHLPGKYPVDGEVVLKLGVIGNILLGAAPAGVRTSFRLPARPAYPPRSQALAASQ